MNGTALVTALVDAYNRRAFDRVASAYTADARVHPAGWDEAVDVRTWLSAFEMMLTSFPDLTLTARHVAAGDDVVVLEAGLAGTNTGPFHLGDLDRLVLGTRARRLPPTGRAMDIDGTVVFETVEGLVAAERHYWRTVDTLVQLGLVETGAPGPGGRAAALTQA